MTLALGVLLNNRYQITEILGQGGMGAVYAALDMNLNRQVAVKENQYLSDEYGRQFKREASILAGLRHPNLPHVIDYFTIANQGQYLIMDFIEGEDLRQRIERNGVMPEQDIVIMGSLICDALEYLHTRKPGVIHRDIKPGNIKITPEGQIVLVDFGLVKLMKDGQETESGARAMTPGYSPPEQYGSARTDPRSDVYSLGATLYAALTGTIPEDGFARITGKADLTPIRQIQPSTSVALSQVIEKALAIDPSERYGSAAQFRAALLAAGELTETAPKRLGIKPGPDFIHQLNRKSAFIKRNPPDNKAANPGISGKARGCCLFSGILFIVAIISSIYYIIGFDISPIYALFSSPLESTSTNISPDSGDHNMITSLPSTQTPTYLFTQTSTSDLTTTPVSTEPIAPSPTSTLLVPEIDSSNIAFSSNRSGIMQIWLMDSSGNNLIQITNIADGACQPSWSPDGMQIVFISPCDAKHEEYPGAKLYTISLDTLQISTLPLPSSSAGDFDPVWSPDGLSLAFTSLRSGIRQIWSYEFLTQNLVQLLDNDEIGFHPAWSPDGSTIAFVFQPSYQQIWLMDPAGQNQSQFTLSGPVNNLWPVWSPDGQVILFNQTSTNTYLPYLMGMRIQDAYSSSEFRIRPSMPEINPILEVDFSPDGSWLLFESWPDGGNHDIFRMSPNGNQITRLTVDAAIDFGAVWRPIHQR